jgi:hypothetical protein
MLSLQSSISLHAPDTTPLTSTAAQQKTSNTPSVVHDLGKIIPKLFNEIVSVFLLSVHSSMEPDDAWVRDKAHHLCLVSKHKARALLENHTSQSCAVAGKHTAVDALTQLVILGLEVILHVRNYCHQGCNRSVILKLKGPPVNISLQACFETTNSRAGLKLHLAWADSHAVLKSARG